MSYVNEEIEVLKNDTFCKEKLHFKGLCIDKYKRIVVREEKELADYATYKMEISEALPKFKFNGTLIREFKEILMPEIGSLIE